MATIPASLRAMPGRWAPFELVPKAKNPDEFDKIPLDLRGRRYKTTLPWFDFDQAARVGARFDGVGLLLTQGLEGVPDHDLLALDCDKVLSDGEAPEWVLDLIDLGGTYAEVSPSGRGVRIIGRVPRGRAFADINPREGKIEAYTGTAARFVTVTGRHWPGAPTTVEQFMPDFLDMLDGPEFRYVKPVRVAGRGGARDGLDQAEHDAAIARVTDRSLAEIRDALAFLDPDADSRAEWVRVGQNLVTLGDAGRAIWDEWSARSDLFDPDDQARRWAGFHGDRSDYRSIFERAYAAGWQATGGTTEDALALRFAEAHAGSYRWSPGLDWMRDDGSRWVRDETRTRFTLARELCRDAGKQGKPADRHRLGKAATVAAVLTLAASDPRIATPASAWDADPWALNTPEGVIDLRTGLIRARTGDDLLTKVTGCRPVMGAQAPVFARFLSETFLGDDDLIAFVQRMLGYAITGDRREQAVFFAHGTGGNGKSVLLDTVMAAAGDYGGKVPSNLLMRSRGERHPVEIAQLQGMRLTVASELDDGQHWDEARLKELTGDTTVRARFMRQDPFEFKLTNKFVIVGNHKPRLHGGDPAIARRMVLVPFAANIPRERQDKALPEKLRAELPAILGWLIEGARQWHERGLDLPEAVKAATADYLGEHDDLATWLGECCRYAPGARAAASDLYASFRRWKEARGEHAPSMTAWGARMAVGCRARKVKSDGRMTYQGIDLTSEGRYAIEGVSAWAE